MTGEQAVLVLAYLSRAGLVIAAEGAAAVWRDALADVAFEDAQEAARHLAREGLPDGKRIATPADLLAVVRRTRRQRIRDRVPPAPPVPLDPAGELAFGRAYLRALGDGASEADADAAACARVGLKRAPAIEGPRKGWREAVAALGGRLADDERDDERED